MQKLKLILKITGFTFLALLLALIIFPFVFKDKIIEAVKNAINDNLEAEVAFEKIDLSVWKSFPDINISVHDLSITGVDTFESLQLLKTDRLDLDFSFWSVVGKNITPSLKYIGLQKPVVNILVLNDSLANYMIARPSSDTTASTQFKLVLEGYQINDGTLSYRDRAKDMTIQLKELNHSGKGDFTRDIFKLQTLTTAGSLDFIFGGTGYLNKVAVTAKADIDADLTRNRYTLLKNEIKLNELDLKLDGYTQLNDRDIDIDFTFSTPNESFRNFISILPAVYSKDFKNVKTEGQASVNGFIRGKYAEKPASLPGFDIKVKINNGFLQYPGFNETISAVNADIQCKAERSDYKDLAILIPVFSMKIGKDFVDGNISVTNAAGNGKASGKVHADVNLANFKNALPLPAGAQLEGKVDLNLSFDAAMNDINNENYEAINFSGRGTATGLRFRFDGNPEITIPVAKAEASPKLLHFMIQDMKAGRSDLNIDASLSNPLAVFSTEKATTTRVNAVASVLDLNEWLGDKAVSHNGNPMDLPSNPDNELLEKAAVFLKARAGTVRFKDMDIRGLDIDGSLAANHMEVKNLSGSLEDSDFRITGALTNAYNYFMKGEMLTGEINFSSKKFNLNRFMTNSTSTGGQKQEGIIPVPANIQLEAHASIDELLYTNLTLKKFRGMLEIKNCQVAMRDVSTDVFGGKIGMEGVYNTEDLNNPGFAFKMDVSKLKYAEAFTHMQTFASLAPVARFIDGVFNTTLILQGRIGANMLPDITTLNASGFIETLNGTIKNLKPLQNLSDKLGLNQLKEIDMNNTRNWFEIQNGFLEVKPFTRKIGDIEMVLQGRHGIGKEMDYNILLDIPREMLQKSNVLSRADAGLAFLEKEASKRGIDINQGSHIRVNVNLKGMLNNPLLTITPMSASGKSLTQTASEAVKDKLEDVKEEITSELKAREEKLRDTITKRVESEVEKARSKAEEATEKAIENVTSRATEVVNQQIDSLAKNVLKDSLGQKAKDVLGEKAGQEVDNIKNKLKDFNPFKKKGGG
ncbi:MAG: hypothetical protein IPM26_00865 [Saprospiraceae bacterium]|nr:hypothetical protein [Saprospiraceae bacterium]